MGLTRAAFYYARVAPTLFAPALFASVTMSVTYRIHCVLLRARVSPKRASAALETAVLCLWKAGRTLQGARFVSEFYRREYVTDKELAVKLVDPVIK